METYQKLYGTTVDKFKIGLKNQRIVLTGMTSEAGETTLKDRDDNDHVVDSTVFFTANIVGRGNSSTAAYEIKGCYVIATTTVTGYVVNTYVDTGNFTEPVIEFSETNAMSIKCIGVDGDIVNWTASVELLSV